MILVVFGTWGKPFVRPLKEIEEAVKAGLINEEVIVQCGVTDYKSEYFKSTPFFDQKDLEQLYIDASFIICHAGEGSIMMGLQHNKKVISIARLIEYDEHIDDHQTDILTVFSKYNYILPWSGKGDLPAILEQLKTYQPAIYPFGNDQLSNAIMQYIDNNIKI